jgi:hypothetical protein
MLQQVLEALPVKDRQVFVREVLQSLDEEEKLAIIREVSLDKPRDRAIRDNDRVVDVEALLKRQSATKPKSIADRLMQEDPDTPEKPRTDAEKLAKIEAEFKKMAAREKPANQKRAMIGQLLGCLGIALAVAAALVLLAVGGRAAFEWLVQLLSQVLGA